MAEHDALGNLLRVGVPGGTNITYIVDGAGRRIGKKRDGELVQGFLYQGGINPVAELDPDGRVTSLFLYATKGNVPDVLLKEGEPYRIISDHLGSVRLVVHADTGEVAQRMDYDEFGNILQDTHPGFQPSFFAGLDEHEQM